MADLFAGWRFALRRFRANWWLMLLVGVGALLATTLLAASPIYADSMSDIGLRFRLERGLDEPRERVAFVSADGLQLGDPVALGRQRAIDEISEARVGWLGPEILVEQRSAQLQLSFAAAASAGRRPWPAHLVYLSGLADHVTVVEGRLPSDDAGAAEVVLPDGFQREAAIGDVVRLRALGYDDCQNIPVSVDSDIAAAEVRCEPTTFVTPSGSALIVGFVRPDDPTDLRWQFFAEGWAVPAGPPTRGGDPGREGPLPLLTSEEQYFGAFAAQLPELSTRHRVGIVPDLEGLAVRDVPEAIDALRAWTRDIREELGVPVAERLDFEEALAEFRNAQTFSQVPLLLLLLQVSGVVAFYIVVLTAMVRERQAQEVAVYRSRGASTGQLLGLSLVEGLLLVVPAAIVGPFLASRTVAALGFTPAFDPITGGSALPAAASDDAFLLAAAGATLALAAMLLPALGSFRHAIVDVKREQARPQRHALLQRYYLDLGAVAVAAILLWQLDRHGTVFDPESVGGWSADPLLLLSPLVITVAAAAVMLRLYPPLLRALAWVLRPLHGTAVALGVGRAGREPATTGRLLLLVSTAVAVGTFAASYAPTVDASFEDRALYATGVDLRGTIAGFELSETRERLAAVRALDGVDGAVLVHRGRLPAARGGSVELLAIGDLDVAAEMLWSRADFADEPPAELLQRVRIGIPPGDGLALPDDAVRLEFAALSEVQPRLSRVRGRLRDGDGRYSDVVFERIESGEWTTVSAAVPSALQRPLTLVSLELTDLPLFILSDGSITFDDVAAIRAGGERVVLDDFEGGFGWTIYSQRASDERFELSGEDARSGEGAARWSWTREVSTRSRVLALEDPAVPLSAILSEAALATFGARPGDRVDAVIGDGFTVPIVVRGGADLFATLDPEDGFAIVQFEQFRSIAGTVGSNAQAVANELWVDFEDDLPLDEQEALVALLSEEGASPLQILAPVHQAARLDEVEADPTLKASGSGILLLAFGGAMGAAVLGFVVTLVMTVRARVVELAVLRALGSSRLEILRAMLLEWGVVLLFGTATGVLLGRQIARLILQFLEVTEDGERVVPSFVLATEWGLLGVGLAVLTGVAVLVLWSSWRIVLRRANAAALRLTQ